MEKRSSSLRWRGTWPVVLLVLGVFLFYWFELRPISIYRKCSSQASVDARALLASKASIAAGTSQGDSFNKLIEKNLYLRSDYESFLMKCLMYHGMQISPLNAEDAPPAEAVDQPMQ